MNEIITIKMTLDEARQCVNEIKAGINDVGKKLLQLYEGEGWRVLGYATWRECAQVEFGFKQSHAYRLLEFAEVTRNIEFSPIGEKQILPDAPRARGENLNHGHFSLENRLRLRVIAIRL